MQFLRLFIRKNTLSLLSNRKLIPSFLFACSFTLAISSAQANPQGAQVAAGTASVTSPATNTVQINQSSDKAIINWQSFNINKNETTRFMQPGTDSITLNRINPVQGVSQIYGNLSANGRIILVNGAGVFFGPTASVNVASLIASTADLSDANFLSGKYIFNQPSQYSGAIVNQGTLIAKKHGLIALVGQGVSNEGYIEANMGAVILASGNRFTIGLNGRNSLIHFTIDEQTASRANDVNGDPLRDAVNHSGTIIADGGKVIIAAKTAENIVDHAINMQGIIQANTVNQVDGQIILSGGDTGLVEVKGELSAKGKAMNQEGGKVSVSGEYLQFEDQALVDVSGENGGGVIRLAGNAADSYVYVGPNVSFKADALQMGEGGKIVITSPENATYAYGSFSAQGGKIGGRNGVIDIPNRHFGVEPLKALGCNARPTPVMNIHGKNLENISFEERAAVEGIINQLTGLANDPYAASLPMIMSAELGDAKGYQANSAQMLKMLEMLESKPEMFPQWMQSNSFKAWMWGRVLLAADSINDVGRVSMAQNKLSTLLNGKITDKDSSAFFTWAWGYRAALNPSEYQNAGKDKMMEGARQLTTDYKNSGSHDQLSNALWAWVMNIQAAARAGDRKTYENIKNEMKRTAGTDSVSVALETGLLRTADSNDYPAWAMAIVRRSAAAMGDAQLFQEIGATLTLSMNEANKAGAQAEYSFSVLDNQLAMYSGLYTHRLAGSTLVHGNRDQ